MASTPDRRILTPRSRKPAFRRTPASTNTHAFASQVFLDDVSNTSPPATPELDWSETPPATEDPPTPEDDFDPDDVVPLPDSPLTAGKTALEQPVVPLHNFSQLDVDVPVQLLSQLSSETDPKKRLFQNVASEVTLNASSRLNPPPSTDNQPEPPQTFVKVEAKESWLYGTVPQQVDASHSRTGYHNDAIAAYTTAGDVSTFASGINQGDRSVVSEDVTATETQTRTNTATSAAKPSQRSVKKKPLTLSFAWSLNTKLSTILPLEAVERFNDSPLQCIATTKEGVRCKRSVAKTANKSFVKELSKALSSLEGPLDFGAFAQHLGPLIESVTCTRSHREPVRKCLEELCSYSWRPCKIATTKPHQRQAIVDMVESIFELWVSALSFTPRKTQAVAVSTKRDDDNVRDTLCSASELSAAVTERSPAPFRNDSSKVIETSSARSFRATDKNTTITSGTIVRVQQVTDSAPVRLSTHLNHQLVKFPYSKEKRNATPQDLIRQILLKVLTPADMWRAGYIYVFWHPGSLGYVKIGYATDVEKRLQAWRRQCKFDLEQHKSQESKAIARVLHLHRVESLIHAELKDYRMFEPSCTGCGKSHREWFEVDPSYALKVVAKWTSRSFYSGGLLDSSISDEEIDKLCELTKAETYLPRPLPRPRKVPASFRRSIRGRHRGVK
ncbi:uncharacterized protein Z520_04588 [Fonsecaea multimorphosa CBS 102226]|uniref:Bacteriophage T5 Orf172 DNA-binding domain-containing protein n=1 Tax=Fonsecaea multimorphosa CBS 102226 TaxID=1442371 RepID=A0A0D2HDJ0_9EURO|nr:uncharacterized protein Z520_04588 [Fonsecaea multimorphosa CBS 102226]KIX99950.1 hypothetical protein Z520_04588 [Fonsecaea multimorphosa CBS 102226]OAL26425.1 hypothetical protein AYO22_04343 [Fonsecaea multimorphosa]